MKNTLIKKLLVALCLASALFSASSANAVTIGLESLLGTVDPANPNQPGGEVGQVQYLVDGHNASAAPRPLTLPDNPGDEGTESYVLVAGFTGPATLPSPVVEGFKNDNDNTTIVITSGLCYDYIFAKYGSVGYIYYIGNIDQTDGEITVPGSFGPGLGLSHTSFFNGHECPPDENVPDGGTTVAMLGLALGGIAVGRRFFVKA